MMHLAFAVRQVGQEQIKLLVAKEMELELYVLVSDLVCLPVLACVIHKHDGARPATIWPAW